jgi:hypothetical protein
MKHKTTFLFSVFYLCVIFSFNIILSGEESNKSLRSREDNPSIVSAPR